MLSHQVVEARARLLDGELARTQQTRLGICKGLGVLDKLALVCGRDGNRPPPPALGPVQDLQIGTPVALMGLEGRRLLHPQTEPTRQAQVHGRVDAVLSYAIGRGIHVHALAIPGLGHHRAVGPSTVGRVLQGVFDTLEGKFLAQPTIEARQAGVPGLQGAGAAGGFPFAHGNLQVLAGQFAQVANPDVFFCQGIDQQADGGHVFGLRGH